jgi:GDPmannose 4,6-dehydratase
VKPTPRTALIFGVSGQDGALLSRMLLQHGYRVHGTSRDHHTNSFANLARLGIHDQVVLHSAALTDFRSTVKVISDVLPDRIFNFAAQSSVALSFEQPVETLNSIVSGSMNLLESIRFLKLDTKLYNACSSECFGDIGESPATEATPFHPKSPYGVAKSAAYWAVSNYRDSYNLFACSGLLFNHESPLRPQRYVTQKIVRGVVDILERKTEILRLGALDVSRDWGWAEDYVDAMRRMLELDQPDDFIIATGICSSLSEFVAEAFHAAGLEPDNHIVVDPDLKRPAEIVRSFGDPSKASRVLGWRATTTMPQVVHRLIEEELARRAQERQTGG